MDILNSNNEYLLSFLGSIIIPKSKLICLYYERELIYSSPYHCGWDAVIVSIVKDVDFWILHCEQGKWFLIWSLVIETGRLFLAMNCLLKKVDFYLLWSCLVESGLSYGLDSWRSMVSSVMVVIGWLNSEELKCWCW